MRLYLGNCFDIMSELPNRSIDMVLCDLPYGVTDCEWDKTMPVQLLWDAYERILKPNANIVLFGAQPFSSDLVKSRRAWFSHVWYWKKDGATGHLLAKKQPMRNIEDILVFRNPIRKNNEAYTYNPQGLKDYHRLKAETGVNNQVYRKVVPKQYVQTKTGYPKQLLEFKREKNRVHSTQKPVALLEYLIRTYSNRGELILDHCMGSGLSGVACINTSRDFIGIELNPHWFSVAQARIMEADGQQENQQLYGS